MEIYIHAYAKCMVSVGILVPNNFDYKNEDALIEAINKASKDDPEAFTQLDLLWMDDIIGVYPEDMEIYPPIEPDDLEGGDNGV